MKPTDPRIAALYDLDNPDGPDHDYWRTLADDVEPTTAIDLGCGTGLLTVTLTSPGRAVIGIDPDESMLAIARRRPGGGEVEWRLGDSRAIGGTTADLVLMTGNVAQHIDRDQWVRTLADISRAMSPGGVLGFESRNPAARAWRSWTPELTLSTRQTAHGELTEWLDASEPDEHGVVVLIAHNVWTEAGEDLVITQSLTFRSMEQLEEDLVAAGLSVRRVHGGWAGEPFAAATSPLMVITAEKRAPGAGTRQLHEG